MHIAICDDNVADRKQLERLLGRESDARKSDSGVFYTDSFGTFEQLFPKRMSYDLFFVDIDQDNDTGLDLAIKLVNEGGVSAPIIMCSSKTDYEKEAASIPDIPGNILFMKKPILKAELKTNLDKAIEIKENEVGTIELRHQNGTYYVYENDIVYVKEHGRYLDVSLSDGRMISILDSVDNFYSTTSQFPHLVRISLSAVINTEHIEKISLNSVVLKSGDTVKSTLLGHRILKNTLKYLKTLE